EEIARRAHPDVRVPEQVERARWDVPEVPAEREQPFEAHGPVAREAAGLRGGELERHLRGEVDPRVLLAKQREARRDPQVGEPRRELRGPARGRGEAGE